TFRNEVARYDHSESLFRMVTLVLGLKRFCGVRYDPAKIGKKPWDPYDLHEQFVYGPIQGPGGTCATLPVLYAAIGRRLRYPIRLVQAKGHMFCRWDDPATGVRVNIEGTTQDGVNTYPDDEYRRWPYSFDEEEERVFGYLRSLTPRQELAAFVSRRACQWRMNGIYRRAMAASVLAMALDGRKGPAIFARTVSG